MERSPVCARAGPCSRRQRRPCFLLGWMPLVGTIIGIVGAVKAWGWPWLQALLLFGGPFLIAAAIAATSGMLDWLRDRRDARAR